MTHFDKEKVLLLQKLVIESSGGEFGVRDFDLLDSALQSAYQTFDGNELFPTKEEKAARLGFGLVNNHAFVDGNKRIGLLVMISFLELGGIRINATDDELVEVGLGLATGEISYEKLVAWIEKHKKVTSHK
jgi:death-on-curing protein